MRRPKLGSIYRPKYRRRDGTLVQSNNYWIKYYVNGVPLREPVHSESYHDAEMLLGKRNGDTAAGKTVEISQQTVYEQPARAGREAKGPESLPRLVGCSMIWLITTGFTRGAVWPRACAGSKRTSCRFSVICGPLTL